MIIITQGIWDTTPNGPGDQPSMSSPYLGHDHKMPQGPLSFYQPHSHSHLRTPCLSLQKPIYFRFQSLAPDILQTAFPSPNAGTWLLAGTTFGWKEPIASHPTLKGPTIYGTTLFILCLCGLLCQNLFEITPLLTYKHIGKLLCSSLVLQYFSIFQWKCLFLFFSLRKKIHFFWGKRYG